MSDLYERALLDHARRPRNFGPLPSATHSAAGTNPLCGDELTLRLRAEHDRIEEIAFEAQACAVCMGSASLMTTLARGMTLRDVPGLLHRVHLLLQGQAEAAKLGDLAPLAGVSRFAARVKCAALPWSALEAALALKKEAVTTEA